ncbi:MAG: hypothetical protein J6D25_00205 [Eggerthellaceae bacterium]|nr:hypothetical protein [Eggerthellaceae bacterium]
MTVDATRSGGRASARDERAGRRDAGHVAGKEASGIAVPARFSLIYESRDGRLCVFEDADGHLTSVNSRRFA